MPIEVICLVKDIYGLMVPRVDKSKDDAVTVLERMHLGCFKV